MTRFIFNLDGVLISENIFTFIARRYGAEREIENIVHSAGEDNIPFMESFIRRLHILSKFPVDKIYEVLEEMEIYPNLLKFIREHKENCAVATEYPGCWADGLLKRVTCSYYRSEGLVENNNVKKLTHILKKENIVERYKNAGEKTVFIGSGDNDMEAMRVAEVSIASGLTGSSARSILSVADYLVFTEGALCRQLNQLL